MFPAALKMLFKRIRLPGGAAEALLFIDKYHSAVTIVGSEGGGSSPGEGSLPVSGLFWRLQASGPVTQTAQRKPFQQIDLRQTRLQPTVR